MMPHSVLTDALIAEALREDLGQAGDITTDAVVPAAASARATFAARAAGRLAGGFLTARVLQRLDPKIEVELLHSDGDDVKPGDRIARVAGNARAILSGERTALNFLGRLSGIATATREFKARVGRTPPEIVATRKTTPGLRALEKYAVRAGGGGSHRYGLYDAVLIKDNHIAVAGSLEEAVTRVRRHAGHLAKIQVEVDTLDQLEKLLALGADAVLLDNMSLDELREAVRMSAGRMLTEASGGITLSNVQAVADTGVDQISIGALTHSARSLDIGLDIEL